MKVARFMRRCGWPGVCGVLALALLLAACSSQGSPDPTASLEERAQAIDKTIMCPVCPSETIDQSQVPLAQDMRRRVREMLAEGKTAGEIRQHFVDAYTTEERSGEWILASPPAQGVNLTAWVIPPVGLLLGGGVVALAVRAMRRRGPGEDDDLADLSDDETSDLAPYLARVDAELEGETDPVRTPDPGASP